MKKTTKFAIPDEPRPTGPRTRSVVNGHLSFLVDDVSREVVIVDADGKKSKTHFLEVNTHLSFEEAEPAPNMWSLVRQIGGVEVIESALEEFREHLTNNKKEE